MKRIITLSLIGLAIAVSPAVADFYIAPGDTASGELTWSVTQDEVTVINGGNQTKTWQDTRTQFTYDVTRPEVGPYTYKYTFTAPDPGLSHLDLQVSADMTSSGGLPAFSTTEPMDFVSTQAYTVYVLKEDKLPSWWPDDSAGIRFEGGWVVEQEGTVKKYTIEFESYRNPMWGNIYATGGHDEAWNTALGTVLVPNASYVPVPGAFLLGSLGLGYAGMKLRRKCA